MLILHRHGQHRGEDSVIISRFGRQFSGKSVVDEAMGLMDWLEPKTIDLPYGFPMENHGKPWKTYGKPWKTMENLWFPQ